MLIVYGRQSTYDPELRALRKCDFSKQSMSHYDFVWCLILSSEKIAFNLQ